MPTLQVFDTVWNGTIDAAACRAQQLAAPPLEAGPLMLPKPRRGPSASELVRAWLRVHPWSALRQICAGTGVAQPSVNGILQTGLIAGTLERSHSVRVDRSRPVLWRVVPR